MADRITQTAAVEKIRGILAEAAVPAIRDLSKHGSFDDIEANLQFVQHGIAALKGIGAMMLGGTDQMNAHIYEAASVFDFMAEAMEGPAQKAYDALETLQRDARARELP